MQSYEFMLVFALLLGTSIILMQPVWEHKEKWDAQQDEWKIETKEIECTAQKNSAETHSIVWKDPCLGINSPAGWDSNHYA
jgi:hypothetical protein